MNVVLDSTELIQLHRAEVETSASSPFCPDRILYNALEQAERLIVVTARCNGKLVGYEFVIIQCSHHHPDTWQGVVDCLYMHPSYRLGQAATKLIALTDVHLLSLGIHEVFHMIPVFEGCRDWSPVLKRMGYKHIENVFRKGL